VRLWCCGRDLQNRTTECFVQLSACNCRSVSVCGYVRVKGVQAVRGADID
jgi:hypothetical protein